MILKLASITQKLKLPSVCTLCYLPHKAPMAICQECIALFPTLGSRCHLCAHPLPDPSFLLCGYCIKQPPSFDAAYIHYRYAEPLRQLLHQFKYNQSLYLTSALSQLILNALPKEVRMPECLIPVPMHHQRIKIRSYNQAAVLTGHLAKLLKLPYRLDLCKKIINTAPQASLAGNERRQNLKNVFEIKEINFKHVAIIDDLLTTGSTADALATTLKNQGVQRVDVWCCARATLK